MMHILVVNINNLKYTKDLIDDLSKQTYPFKLTLVDQGSSEIGTQEYLNKLALMDEFRIVGNDTNVDLCRLWNKFYLETTEPYLCFLNNDIRVTSNFVSDTVEIFKKEAHVGCVVHISNDSRYQESELSYVIPHARFVQGWDFSLRREAYTLIPDEFKMFGGDDYLFLNLYSNGWKVAVALSSPIIHYGKKSYGYYRGNRHEEIETYLKGGHKRNGYPRLRYGATLR